MNIKKLYAYIPLCEQLDLVDKGLFDTYSPPTVGSIHWKNWVTHISSTTCLLCLQQNGQIYGINDIYTMKPPLHPNYRCTLEPMKAVEAGNGTKDCRNGADWWIKHMGRLPDYYISGKELEALGWKWGKAPRKFAPGKMMTKGVYQNKNKHLPDAPGRIWYEADINYYEGWRNRHRLLWSNDGLMFLTYDHYETFYEVI